MIRLCWLKNCCLCTCAFQAADTCTAESASLCDFAWTWNRTQPRQIQINNIYPRTLSGDSWTECVWFVLQINCWIWLLPTQFSTADSSPWKPSVPAPTPSLFHRKFLQRLHLHWNQSDDVAASSWFSFRQTLSICVFTWKFRQNVLFPLLNTKARCARMWLWTWSHFMPRIKSYVSALGLKLAVIVFGRWFNLLLAETFVFHSLISECKFRGLNHVFFDKNRFPSPW